MSFLDQARAAIQQGDKAAAKTILVDLVAHESQNAAAWSLLAEVLDDPQQISFCRQRAQSLVQVEPSNTTRPVESIAPDEGQTHSSDLKKCPYCAETIKAEAIVCRFCGRDLRTGQALPTAIPANQGAEHQPSSLDRQVETLTSSGWQVINRTPTTAQLRKPKQWSSGCLVLFVLLPLLGGFFFPPLFGVAVVGLILAVLDYLLKKDETVYCTEEQLRQVEQRKQDEQRQREEKQLRQAEQRKQDEQRQHEEKQLRQVEQREQDEQRQREEKRGLEKQPQHGKQASRAMIIIGLVVVGIVLIYVLVTYTYPLLNYH